MAFEAPEVEISSNAGDPTDIRNISGTVSLPTGAATAARQDTGNTTLATIDGKTPALVAGSVPVLTKNSSNVETGTAAAPYRVDPTGTTVQPVSASALPLPSGASTSALQTSGNTSLNNIDLKINSLTTAPSTSAAGIVVRPVSVEYPTFVAVSTSTTVGANKSMLAIQNTGTSVVRIREIWIINDQNTAVTGVAGNFQILRIASFTLGVPIVPISYDTIDTLPAGISVATGSTVVGELGLLRQGVWSTDEWGPGTADTESFDHSIQNTTPFFAQTPSGKALTIRQNQGIHIKFATASTAGAFNLRIVFTTE